MQTRNRTVRVVAVAGLIMLASMANAQLLRMCCDGDFSDWTDADLIGTDPEGDVLPGDLIDWRKLWAVADNNFVCLSYETSSDIQSWNRWRYIVYLDTDDDPSTGFVGGNDVRGADYMIEGIYVYRHIGFPHEWRWVYQEDATAGLYYALNGNRVEMFIAGIRLLMRPPYVFNVMLAGNNHSVIVAETNSIDDFAPNYGGGFHYPRPGGVVIDSNFADWTDAQLLGTDERGDVGPGDPVDWRKLWAQSVDGNLCLSYEIDGIIDFNSDAWRYGIYMDTDNNAATGFRHWDGSWGVGAEYLVEGGYLYEYTGSGTDWSWSWIDWTLYSYVSDRLEMSIPESWLGLSGAYSIQLLLLGHNTGVIDYAPGNKAGYTFTPEIVGTLIPVMSER